MQTLERYEPADPELMPDDERTPRRLCGAVRRLLPGLDPIPVATERCVYDNSDDTDFVLDRVGSVVVGCGTSGHGFKFGPLFGQVLADLAEEVAPSSTSPLSGSIGPDPGRDDGGRGAGVGGRGAARAGGRYSPAVGCNRACPATSPSCAA